MFNKVREKYLVYIGLTILFVQDYFQLLEFPNPKEYYMKTIPVYINLDYIIALNIGTFLLCLMIIVLLQLIVI